MAFDSTTIHEVETGGSDTANGGSFDPGNANFPTNLTATNANTASPVISSASYTWVAGDVGAWALIKSGTNWTPMLAKVASVSGGSATLNCAVGAAMLVVNNIPTTPNTVAGCATVASPTGGTWGMDYSQQSSPQIAFTDLVIDGTTNTNCTSSANPFGKNHIGNSISITSGTGFTVQRVQIVNVSGTAATCDKSLGTLSSTGGHGGLGGAYASMATACSLTSSTNGVFCQTATYTITSAGKNVSGGQFSPTGGGASSYGWICGYGTNRCLQNTDTGPTFQPNANSLTCAYIGTIGERVRNLQFANPGNYTGCVAIQCDYNAQLIERLNISGFAKGVNITNGGNTYLDITITNASGGYGFAGGGGSSSFENCTVIGGSQGITLAGTNVALKCITTGQSGTGAFGFNLANAAEITIRDCIVDNVTGTSSAGMMGVSGSLQSITDCAVTNCTLGLDPGSASVPVVGMRIANLAVYGNTSNYSSSVFGSTNIVNLIQCSVNPWTNSSSKIYTTNNTSGGGALLRGQGYPQTFPGLTGSSSSDVGAFQAASATPGALFLPSDFGGGYSQ